MSLALLFPGQGVQHAGMLPWLSREALAQPALGALAAMLGDNWQARLVDEDWASSNAVAQPLMTGIALAAWQVLAADLPRPTVLAGYSVGELAAFSAAGLFDVETALQLARQRAALMDGCAGPEPAGLLSVAGFPVTRIVQLCERRNLSVAIRLGPDRCVLGGSLAALASARPELLAAGAELKPLRVRVASHTPAMAAASQGFQALIEPMPWPRPSAVLVCNLDGAGRRDPLALKKALAQQISHTVAWDQCLTSIAERQPSCVLEVGPGSTLARQWAAACPEVPVRSIDEFQSRDAVVAWVRQAHAA